MFAAVGSSFEWWFLALAISLLNVFGAAAVVWHARKVHRVRPALAPSPSQPAPSTRQPQLDAEAFRILLERLQDLATATAHGVGEHSTRLQSVSARISASKASDGKSLHTSLWAAATQMLEANQKLEAELAETESELQDQARRIEVHIAEARTDALAGVANRRALDEELARRYATWKRQGTPLSFLIIDADHFKRFNDTYGHQAGDEVLRGIGRVLAATVRDMDMVARYGGEEFAFVLPGTQLEDAKSAAERFRIAIADAEFSFADQELHVTVSVGAAQLHAGDTVPSLLKHADMALYAAKTNGRNRSYYHDGVDCLPVDAGHVAAQSEVAQAVHKQVVEADYQLWSFERRGRVRHPFPQLQSIAPCVDGELPAPDEFRDVLCRDINSAGFSFWLPAPPDFSSLVVALGTGDAATYVLAEIVHATPIHNDYQNACLVGCLFKGRVDLRGGLRSAGRGMSGVGVIHPSAVAPLQGLGR